MRALIVFESMYGNTHAIADALASGLRPHCDVEVVHVGEVRPAQVVDADFLVVGGPTHVHGMSSSTTRKGAVDTAAKSSGALVIDPGVSEVGLRDWFDELPEVRGHGTPAVAFDTRAEGPVLLTGHASKSIAARLRKHGYTVVAEPQSFLVDRANHLLDGELQRAQAWAETALTTSLAAH
jgi:hypothetical protein